MPFKPTGVRADAQCCHGRHPKGSGDRTQLSVALTVAPTTPPARPSPLLKSLPSGSSWERPLTPLFFHCGHWNRDMQDWWGLGVSARTPQDCRSIGHHTGGRDTPGKGQDQDMQALRTRTALFQFICLERAGSGLQAVHKSWTWGSDPHIHSCRAAK